MQKNRQKKKHEISNQSLNHFAQTNCEHCRRDSLNNKDHFDITKESPAEQLQEGQSNITPL